MVKSPVTIFLILLCTFVQAQSGVIDSLNTAYSEAKHDTDKINCLFVLSDMLIGSNTDTVFLLAETIQRIAQKGLESHVVKSSPDSTLLKNKYSEAVAEALSNLGYLYQLRGNIPKSLELHHKSLKVAEEAGYMKGVATCYLNISYIHDLQGDIDQSIEYAHKAVKTQEEIGNKRGIVGGLNNLGVIYETQGKTSKALEKFHAALSMAEELTEKRGLAKILDNLGRNYMTEGNVDTALYYHYKSLAILEEIVNEEGICYTLTYIGRAQLAQGNLEEARKSAERGLELALKGKFTMSIARNASLLSSISKMEGNFKEALELYELQIKMQDSVNNEETQKATTRQQTKYEFEKAQLVKEQEEKEHTRVLAEETSRRDNLQYSIVLICLLVIGGLVAMLGRLSLPERVTEGLIFFAFLIFFEFVLVLADPYVDDWTGGAPGLKLLINAGVAALIFPLHAFFESKLKSRLVKQ